MNTVHNIYFSRFFYFTYFQALGLNCIRRCFKFNKEIFNIETYTEHKHSKFFLKHLLLLNEVCLVGYKKA